MKTYDELMDAAELQVSHYALEYTSPCEYAQVADQCLQRGIQTILAGNTEEALLSLSLAYAWLKYVEDGVLSMKTVDIHTMQRIVLRLSNQGWVRYWLDADATGTFTKMAIEFYYPKEWKFPIYLDKEMTKEGFERTITGVNDSRAFVRWEAQRTYLTE